MLVFQKLRNRLLFIGLMGAIATGCTATTPLSFQPLQWRSPEFLKAADLTLQVQPTDEPGKFTVTGTADLPEGTELTVLAIRQLRLQNSPLVSLEPQPTYSILSYETVILERQQWATTLSLWQVAPDGEYKETWQLQEPELELAVTPDDEVFFLVTLTPLDDLAAIEQQLAAQNQRLVNRYIQTTSEGSRYLQAGSVIAVNLPTGKTAPIGIRDEDINGGWGNRFLELPDLPNHRQLEFPEQRQTNAPMAQEEFLY